MAVWDWDGKKGKKERKKRGKKRGGGVSVQGVVKRCESCWNLNTQHKTSQTSYQLSPQCQVFLPPAAEARQLSSGAVLGQGLPQGQGPQHQALLPLLAELQLAQPGQARLQALLGPTALHGHRERERAVHASPIPGTIKTNYSASFFSFSFLLFFLLLSL